jgi:hypothetical protein
MPRGFMSRVSSVRPMAAAESPPCLFCSAEWYKPVTGRGRFATVFRCVKRIDGCTYAVKRVHQRLTGGSGDQRVLREVFAASALAHCPKLVGRFNTRIPSLKRPIACLSSHTCLPEGSAHKCGRSA